MSAKTLLLGAARAAGIFRLVEKTSWRRQRLVILCYHGTSIDDEHLWNPRLYMDPGTFAGRLALLRDAGFRVLPLDEALTRLENGTLPDRAAAITFDDGTYDFYSQAYPLIRKFDVPVTLYLTTYYCLRQMPVFNSVCAYVLWKNRGRSFDAGGFLPEGGEVTIPDDAEAAAALHRRIYQHLVIDQALNAEQKDEKLRQLAHRLGFDETPIRSRRIIHLMTPEEVSEVSRGGIDIQLHTHRHRVPRDRALFEREIHDNRRIIMDLTASGQPPRHFCYPSGVYFPEFFPWLHDLGVRSATSCESALAARHSNPLCLPRILDMPIRSTLEVESWLSGLSGFATRRGS
jgi:peptidoglycan/xylan/chitin deacetylase (PgdA/CDA1 family)